MNFPSETIETAVEQLSRFPGIGKKTALRMTLFLLKDKAENVERMTTAIGNLKTKVNYCSVCGNIAEADVCSICKSVNRNKQLVCVVKDFQDIISIENTGQFNGVYHVLGGVISPMDGIGPDEIAISSLLSRIENEQITELVFALSANMEGDTTAFYISRKVEALNVKISTIARGIAVGGELEYADEITLGRSILNRIPYSAAM
ncbi:MAG: recombination protein RecR [Flavobacteriales bacterium]|nr:recombination protein RecR [Flavobacteriales bacterium]